ncbi:hypothetical protein HPB48_011418 [Haemaphysalis longicornis]|uniref:Uncharacterized protein n=1 Tax=Haemaphysalis longicornis TaxID=44386 RepID=A0A9J6G0B4_HAELO|nr:hypothetical protein HPB48_011418 [Haemaphysalis longicornis]
MHAGGGAEIVGTSKRIRLSMCGGGVGTRSRKRGGPPIVGAGFVGESPAENQGLLVVEGFVGGSKVRVLRDTGCNTVIGLTGAKLPVLILDRSLLLLPEASITVATPCFSGNLKAKCLGNSMYHLVLGNVEGARPVNCMDLHWDSDATKVQALAPGNELEMHHKKQAKGPRPQERGTAYTLESGDATANPMVTRAQSRDAAPLRKPKTTGYIQKVCRSELLQEQKGSPTSRDLLQARRSSCQRQAKEAEASVAWA